MYAYFEGRLMDYGTAGAQESALDMLAVSAQRYAGLRAMRSYAGQIQRALRA
ncbi:MAG: hypothetical protein KatS3mg038_1046 [Candidatus Kapaibacterium sp.]|nr:MAG: hypothetical protein KatS3mg038_1046 [Candidatus Kapabacteria bacterium]